MDWKNPFRKGPKALDGPATETGNGDASPLGDAIEANEAVKKKQMLLLGAGGLAALVIGSSWIFAGDHKSSDASVKRQVEDVSVDEMVNKNMAEKEWRAQSEAQMMSMDTNMRALAARAQRADQLEAQLAQGQAAQSTSGGGMSPDTERVLSAYRTKTSS
jgi:conjugal transfer pilus assembly protein TraB